MPFGARDRLFDALLALGQVPGARVLLSGPIEIDGDSIGACLALRRVLARHGVEADVAGDLPWRYDTIPQAERLLPDAQVTPTYPAVVILDGDKHRLKPEVEAAFHAASLRGLIDHHASTRIDGYTHAWLAPKATSTCEMLYNLFLDRGEALDSTLAAQLHAGSIFDTGGFRHGNTTPATLRMAAALVELGADHVGLSTRILMERTRGGLTLAGEVYGSARAALGGRLMLGRVTLEQHQRLGLRSGDLEGLVESLLQVIGVDASALLIEKANGTVKVSFRSRGGIDVAEVAHRLAPVGGGHPRASGVTLALGLPEAEEAVTAAIEAAFAQAAQVVEAKGA